ncbi:MAG TPA: thiamine phosphate synthase [Vicinamibacteria bacterium]|nr:thiamine phosphate synthase [Vicinamibacteria bacterium]
MRSDAPFVLTMVTDRSRLPTGGLVACALEVARAGVDAVQVREKDLHDGALRALAAAVREALGPEAARVFVNGRPDVALAAGAHGVQLPEDGLPVAGVKDAFPSLVVGASCHSVEAVRRAADEGADFVLLGPVFATPGKEARALGIGVLAAAVSAVRIPVYAIGGVTPDAVATLRAAGARGAAAIRPFHGGRAEAAVRAFRAAERGAIT